MNQPDGPDQHVAADEAAADDAAQRRDELVVRAREACVDHPELAELLERLDRLPQTDLANRPAELDAVHRVLREALANAGRPGAA